MAGNGYKTTGIRFRLRKLKASAIRNSRACSSPGMSQKPTRIGAAARGTADFSFHARRRATTLCRAADLLSSAHALRRQIPGREACWIVSPGLAETSPGLVWPGDNRELSQESQTRVTNTSL